jgi:hypothetical protein
MYYTRLIRRIITLIPLTIDNSFLTTYKHTKYSSIISSNYIFKGLARETLGPWCKEAIDFINVIGNRLIAESGDSNSQKFLFSCHSTWKCCKHSGHFSRFCIIIGNFCIVKEKCYVLKLIN